MKNKINDNKEKIALFRFGIISPIIYETHTKQNEYFRLMAQKEYLVPGIGTKKFTISAFKSWLNSYRKGGFDSIKPKTRHDKGTSKIITPNLLNIINDVLKEGSIVTYTQLFRTLLTKKHIQPFDFSIQTLIKFMKDNNISLNEKEDKPRKKFEALNINELWICDFMHSIFIYDAKKKKQTFLCAIIDDHSRVITGFKWAFFSSSIVLEETLKSAIFTYGLPKRFYCDNAKVFSSQNIHIPCANLGIALIHSKPYEPQSRGKIERFFRTVQTCFTPLIDKDNINLLQLNELFKEWLNLEYHKKLHKGIGEPPINRFMRNLKTTQIKRISEETLDKSFYIRLKRRVKNDSTLSINGIIYEAAPQFIGNNVEIRYSSSTPDNLFIYENNKPVSKLKKLDVHENFNSPHVSFSFSNLLQNLERKENNNV